jgi:hypothetical protein
MATELIQFGEFTLREVTEEDRPLLEQWIVRDPWHRGKLGVEFFLGFTDSGERDPRATCYVIEDDKGEVFFIRLSRASRVNIQFAPTHDAIQKERNRKTLMEGMAFLEGLLSNAGADEWIFDTANPELRATAIKRLGFRQSQQELVRRIPSLPEDQTLYGSVLQEQPNSQEVA